MKDTIKAKEFYTVKRVRNIVTGQEGLRVDDGATPLFVATEKSLEEYKSDKAGNDAFEFCECFTTRKGNSFVYWRDNEIDEDYLTRI